MTWSTDCAFCGPLGHLANPAHFLQDQPVGIDPTVALGFPAHAVCACDAESAIKSWQAGNGRRDIAGVWRWQSSGNIPPADILGVWEFLGFITPDDRAASLAQDKIDTANFLERYRRNQPAVPSDEERFEARAAHGPGVEIVDVVTGRRFTT